MLCFYHPQFIILILLIVFSICSSGTSVGKVSAVTANSQMQEKSTSLRDPRVTQPLITRAVMDNSGDVENPVEAVVISKNISRTGRIYPEAEEKTIEDLEKFEDVMPDEYIDFITGDALVDPVSIGTRTTGESLTQAYNRSTLMRLIEENVNDGVYLVRLFCANEDPKKASGVHPLLRNVVFTVREIVSLPELKKNVNKYFNDHNKTNLFEIAVKREGIKSLVGIKNINDKYNSVEVGYIAKAHETRLKLGYGQGLDENSRDRDRRLVYEKEMRYRRSQRFIVNLMCCIFFVQASVMISIFMIIN